MKFQKKASPYKKCPRCGNKCLANQPKCPECGLLFSRLEFATNKAAKKKLIHFDRDYVIFTKDYPSDVKRWKLLLYSILLGWFGMQYYYVGKYIKGFLMSLGFVYLVVGTIFNAQIVAANATLLYLPIAIYALSWIVNISFVILKKFKVPVYVDPTIVEEKSAQTKAEYDRLGTEIAKERKKLEANKKQGKKQSEKQKATGGKK